MECEGWCLAGTSGWNYKHWRERFYPKGLAQKDWLRFYSERFRTVEINTSYYHLPKAESFAAWRDQTPPGFTFAVKASRYITHMKKLKGVDDAVDLFFERAYNLGDKLGPILFQLPPNLHLDLLRLEAFLKILPRGPQHTCEFRHQSWLVPEVYELLRAYGVGLCLIALPGFPVIEETTAKLVYIRMHGSSVKYGDSFPAEELNAWADRIKLFLSQDHDVYIFFNNDANAYAIANAIEIRALVSGSCC